MKHISMVAVAVLAGATIAACNTGDAASPDGDRPGAATANGALMLAPVAFVPASLDLGTVVAVADVGPDVAVFGSKGVTTLTSGALDSSDESVVAWRSAGVIPSADGTSTWLVGVDGTGHVRHVTTAGAQEDVSDCFGLADAKVAAVSASDAAHRPPTAFLLDTGFAVSDGKNVTRYDGAPRAVAAGTGHVAVASEGVVRVLDMAGVETDVKLDDVAFVAYDGAGALYAATHHALYAMDASGARKLWDAGTATVHALAASGSAVWVAVDKDIALYRDGQASVTNTAAFATDATIFGSASGDLWVISGGHLQRFKAEASANGDQAIWTANVQPIYAAVCGNCHGAPGGGKDTSNVDLSTYAAWVARRGAVYTRVITAAGTPSAMPPASSGMTLTDAQRQAIGSWAKPQ